ncbi:sorting nexin-8-like [Actinia tenebrosa]|uniref:Sorting nexin-8-like n=1 Tax=Actinia tenebrosa TaxID=6105 RepID=A0A6P8IL34_ACTTE|nr:sorting nexin-8-like [Actinia tenebrosa]
MAASLTFGSVPQFYREVYQIVCPNQENKIEKEMFVKILVKSSLPKSSLTMIWEAIDPKQEGFITRDGLYKALALTALAQQGKPVSEKALESFVDSELPKPSLGDLSDLKTLSARVRREQNPNILGYNYEDLMALDSVEVDLLAEKKGILLKHNEYQISSKRHNMTVHRRYNDFVAFHDVLISRFPYRLVPKLPPKKLMGASKEFIEARRRALKRFLNVVARHPVLSNDRIVIFFFTIKGSDIGQKMKDQFKSFPDEFVTSPLSVGIKELVPMDVQASFSASKEHIRCIHNSVERMKEIADRITMRTLGFSSDMLAFAKELSALNGDSHPTTVWACGNNDSWGHLKHGFNGLMGHFSRLSDKATAWFKREDCGAAETFALFLEVTSAYKDLCERHEKGVLKDHQNALHKMQQIKKRQILSQAKGQENLVDALESKILEQEADISNMENRNFFSLHCLQLETQLVHANIKMIAVALEKMVASNSLGHKELAQIWAETYPAVESLVPKETASSPPGSPPL